MASVTNLRRTHGAGPPVGRHVETLTLDYDVNNTTITADIQLSGSILDVFFVVPSLDGTQCTLYFLDEDGDEYYNSGLVDENQTHHLTPGFSCTGTVTIKIVTASTQSADRTFKVKIIYA